MEVLAKETSEHPHSHGDHEHHSHQVKEEDVIRIRKESLQKIVLNYKFWIVILLAISIMLGVYIRSAPMMDHTRQMIPFYKFIFLPWTAYGGTPGLWDVTTNTWTLGPDLDPWLFERLAEYYVKEGKLPAVDYMRNVPDGFPSEVRTVVLPSMIDMTYHLSSFFLGNVSVEFAADIFPVIFFVLTIISFFFFVREVFIRKDKESIIKANFIAIIATFFMIVIPVFLSRSIAGIPEKESAAFFFMFLTFYFFLKAMKTKNFKFSIALGILSGLSTFVMGTIWGGDIFIYITIGVTTLIAFLLNNIHKKESFVYASWILTTTVLSLFILKSDAIYYIVGSLNTGIAFLTLFILVIDYILWDTKISSNKQLNKIKLPKHIVSIIVAIILVVVIATLFFGPNFIVDKLKAVHQSTFRPVTGRWNTTVAENRQPYFTEWRGNFGPFIPLGKISIPIFFWLFIIGSILIFRNMMNKLKSKDAWILTIVYIILIFAMIFSRYSSSSQFNGENFISKFVYYGAVILFLGVSIKIYSDYYKRKDNAFDYIDYEYIFILILLLLAIFSARGAVRLIMVLGPIAPIFVGYLNLELITLFIKNKDDNKKLIYLFFAVIVVLLTIYAFMGVPLKSNQNYGFYQESKSSAFSFVPTPYNQQWQYAMDWVRNNTPEDAVFGHWWDYGYWVQSIGERATVLDGGNAKVFWNYWMGRIVLTGDNQQDALDFLYAHNTTHFLIDSTDIGKYGAFSQIGSDENFDRLSQIGVFNLDPSQTQETRNQTNYFYRGGIPLDEDLRVIQDGKELILPAGQTAVGAFIIPMNTNQESGSGNVGQPTVIFVDQTDGTQYRIPMRYVSINGEFFDFHDGINATLFIFPSLESNGQGIKLNQVGAAMFISPRLMRGMLAQIYILNDPLNNFPGFKLVHTEPSYINRNLNAQGANLPDFVYYQGIQGPIKIWEIKYTGNETVQQKYLDTDSSKYLPWRL
ncbi:hypothetical protein COU57_06070 [Candidatus Pacearchaeota archaeon CG10_big_fil_rev_8_21_14_0_10_32_14]|nr:MAG: hypothetical protein COU57_06070 [Candidatus Pacearchaeota archaeon CG10_big_fil_rev_8_21_14_0_10_32_14]